VTRLPGAVLARIPLGLRPSLHWLRHSYLHRADCSAGCSALFAGFTATMAKSDFPRPCIIGYGSSTSRCGPGRHMACGQTRDIPGSDAIRLRVMWPSTTGGTTIPRLTALHMLRSTMKTVSAPAISSFLGSIPHPTHRQCTLRVRRCRRLTQHSLPGGPLRVESSETHHSRS
jgi:hypothetical protein